jgi:hypothetical protein
MTQLANRDNETGIRYGVIPANDLYNCGEQFYEGADDKRYEEYQKRADEAIKHAITMALQDFGVKESKIELAVGSVSEIIEEDLSDAYESDGTGLHYDDGEYIIDKLDETDLFVAKSPYFTFAPECSPCAPGACYLRDGIKESGGARPSYSPEQFVEFSSLSGKEHLKCYCLGHEWFEEEEAPYAVYSVQTGERVYP